MNKRRSIFSHFDSFYEESIINPRLIYGRSDIKLRTVIVTFSYELINHLISKQRIELIESNIKSISGPFPLYKIKNTNVGVFFTHPGASYCVMALEEICSVHGTKTIISFGNCGVIDEIRDADVLVPMKAYKMEGVSAYYDNSLKDYVNIDYAKEILEIFKDNAIRAIGVNVASVDCLYRETKSLVEYCKSNNVKVLDMEISGIQSFCNFHHFRYLPFLYAADSLENDVYEPKDLVSKKLYRIEELFSYALLLAEEL